MPLPLRMLDVELDEAARTVRPRWLGAHDERWVAAVLGVLEKLAGCPAIEADEALRGPVRGIGRAFDVREPTLLLAYRIARRPWTTRVAAPVDPRAIRDVLFELAATRPRAEAVAEAARALGIAEGDVLRSLFADRAGARILVPPERALTPRQIVLAANMALVQALLERSTEVTARVAGDVRSLARRAKRAGLVASFFDEGRAITRVALSGPLAVFHATTRYGRALAALVPHLVATGAWSLVASVVIDKQVYELSLDATSPLAAPLRAREPAWATGKRLARDLAAMRSPWHVEEVREIVRAGEHLFFPDLALVGPRGRVLVDVLPGASRAYVEAARAALRQAEVPVLVCAAAGGEGIVPLLGPRGLIDASALASSADRATPTSIGRAPPPLQLSAPW